LHHDDLNDIFHEGFGFFVVASGEDFFETEVFFFLLDVFLVRLLRLEYFWVDLVLGVNLLQSLSLNLERDIVQKSNPNQHNLWRPF
jgi:hypothetical protein